MSRKRTRESLLQQVCEACSECAGQGVVKTSQTTCVEVFRAILRDSLTRCATDSGTGSGEYLIRATEGVVDRLLDEDAGQLVWLSEEVGRDVRIQVEPSYGPGQFDIMLVQDMRRPA
jgi:ribonuclease G